jgi:hypothetical protein
MRGASFSWIAGLAVGISLLAGACSDDDSEAGGKPGTGGSSGSGGTGGITEDLSARPIFVDEVQPLLTEKCGSCHVGKRFAFASLERAGATFTAEETERNYRTALNLISLDSPVHSRLLEKMLGHMPHAAGAVASESDPIVAATKKWIAGEKKARCAECGESAVVSYLAYVESPRIFWALNPDPIREDHGLRDRARIVLRRIDPATGAPGAPIDFLGDAFCGADDRCDFGHLAPNHAGTKLAFECRLSLTPADWVNEVRWNVCIADIGADGHAENPRFLRPESDLMFGSSFARTDPFGLFQNGGPLKGPYDLHFLTRRGSETGPQFSADDQRLYLASMRPDPRTGITATQTYHGTDLLNHIVSVGLDGSDARSIYLNEGGIADLPFLLRNGNVAFHTWNLERMDRHLYTQSAADGASEIPVLFGRMQGPNMWGRAVQLSNGVIFGMTGRRRSAIDNYVPFVADHTLGLGLDPSLPSFSILDPEVFEQIADFPGGYCEAPPDGPNCKMDRYYADPAWAPDGTAYIAHNPETTYALKGEEMFLGYAKGGTLEEQLAAMLPYTPGKLGISKIDHEGNLVRVVDPDPDKMLTHPAWIGRRWAPVVQPSYTDETKSTAELHIADVPLWFSFARADGDSTGKQNVMSVLEQIVAIRVLTKDLGDNFCLSDARPYRYAANDGIHDHPTHLGKNNSTGYQRLAVAKSAGGDDFGDVPLEADGSVNLKVPAGKLLLFQGIDQKGVAIVQRSRLLALPPGGVSDASVRKDQYESQCMSCHGSLDDGQSFRSLAQTADITLVDLDYATNASQKPAVDVAAASEKPAHFLGALRPLLDEKCVSCHSGGNPAGELSLEKEYSATGNYPAGKWATTPGLADAAYLAFVPPANRVPAYNYSVSYAWNFREDEDVYKSSAEFAPLIASHAPLANLAPWDPAYQNLFAVDGPTFRYLGGYYTPNFGRSDRLGGLSSDAWLIEILTGEDIDPVHEFSGLDHTGFLTPLEVREIRAVIDVGFVYMGRCDDRTVPSGPNAGKPWGDPNPT